MFDALNTAELGLLDRINSSLASPFLDTVVKVVTFTGNAGIIWILCAVLMLCFKKTRRSGIALAVTLALCLLLNNMLLKNIVARPRPFHVDPSIKLIISPPGEYSFPSGHALSSFAASFTIWRFCGKKFGIAACIWAVLISFTRIYLRVHFITDIAGGLIFGILIALLGCFIAKLIFEKYDKKHQAPRRIDWVKWD